MFGQTPTYTLGEVSNQTAEVPYPNLELNTPSAGLSTAIDGTAFGSNSQDVFISVQALFITPDDTLWVLDTGRPTVNATTAPTMPYARPGGPKLCGINLTNNSVTSTYTFPPDVHFPDSYMNDLRFDMRPNITESGQGIAYIVDSSDEGRNGFIILDLGTGQSWRHLNQHPSTLRTFEDVPSYQGIPFYQRTLGEPVRSLQEGADGAELSPDGSVLYYSPLTSDYLYSIETQYLRVDPNTDSLAARKANMNVKTVGQRGGNANGFAGDSNGAVYMLMPEHNAIYNYNTTTLQAEPFVRDPSLVIPRTVRMGPSGDAIAQVAALCDFSNHVAADWLKLFDNDVEKTVNAYYDDPHTLQKKKHENQWNESQFHTDRGNNSGQQSSFTVHRPDSLKPNVFAPSRPPSRVSTRNGLGYNDRTGPSICCGSEWDLMSVVGIDKQWTMAEQEEADLQGVLERSKSQIGPAQENGTIPADGLYFGPAKGEYHDTHNWIMTTSKSTAKEILLNPEPKDRRRQSHTPAFLRPSPAGHRLPGVVKILHTIPAAREALLSRNSIQKDYGYQNEWWDGVPVESPQIIHSEEDPYAPKVEVIHESQRLMAFLDETERAYGSSEALTTIPGIREYQEDAVVKGFLATWTDAVSQSDPRATLPKLFHSTGVRISQGNQDAEEISALDFEVNNQLVERGQTLYDAMDALMWPGWDGTDLDSEVFFRGVADVFIIRLAQAEDTAKGLDIKIPPVWYADRYLQSSQPQIRQMLAAKAAIQSEMNDLNKRKHKASGFKSLGQHGKPLDTSRLLETTRQHFEKTAKYSEEAETTSSTRAEREFPNPKAYSHIADELKVLSDRVAEKLQAFEESKEKARDKLRELSKLFTEPSDIPEENPREKYTLRGVCAEPHTVYVQERTRAGSDGEMLDEGPDEWQWWKLKYEVSAGQPISRSAARVLEGVPLTRLPLQEVREIEVLQAARHESPIAFLVYASERAMAVENKELPSPLKSFVENDNQAFAAELASSSPPPQPSNNPTNRFRSPPNTRPANENIDLPPYEDRKQTFSPPPKNKTYDEYIPASLRPVDDDYMNVDESMEMVEREDADGMLMGEGKGYQLGTYSPEMRMEDDEEEKEEGMRVKGGG
ncbi:MAG: hypothetical protein Q9216_006156 [Gyalolechia sp. 2 TL-2023]